YVADTIIALFSSRRRRPPSSSLFPYTTLFRSNLTKRWTFRGGGSRTEIATRLAIGVLGTPMPTFIDSVEKPEDIWHLTNYVLSLDRKSTRLNSSHLGISYAVFCLKKKKKTKTT